MHENPGSNSEKKRLIGTSMIVNSHQRSRSVFVAMDVLVKWLGIAAIALVLLYMYSTRKYRYWKKKGVKQLSPLPVFGDNYTDLLGLKDALTTSQAYYKPFKGIRFGGLYMGREPFLSITDPELLKKIMVKDADHFINRHDWFQGTEQLFDKNLVSLKDDNWKRMRAVMTTVFTSAKMKDMFGFMDSCGKQAVGHLEEKMKKESGDKYYEIDCKDFFSRYGTDVIASTAFGLEVDSFKNPDNEFYSSGYIIRNLFGGVNLIKLILLSISPFLYKKLGLSIFGEKYNKFFISLIEDTIREREEKNIVRKDVIHILMEARKGKGVNEEGDLIKGKLPDLTDVDIAAQALLFFFGGFETMAQLLGFITYELAVNPDVQENLQQEIDDVIEKMNGVNYDGVIHQMQYLNMVVNETLRKWPTAVMTDRVVSKSYVIPKTDVSPEVVLNKGDSIWVPIAAFHRDPDYFPDPEKFDPERFRDEKNTIKPFTYLPFGEGPRHCIGMRYALMEIKTILVHLLRRFTLVPSEKTCIPMQLSKKYPQALLPANGFFLGLKLRSTAA